MNLLLIVFYWDLPGDRNKRSCKKSGPVHCFVVCSEVMLVSTASAYHSSEPIAAAADRMTDTEDRNTRQRTENDTQSGSWLDLPKDVSTLIVGRLTTVVDCIRFRCVCKNWNLAEFSDHRCKLPWLIGHQWEINQDGDFMGSCKIHIPSTEKIYTGKNILVGEEEQIYGAGICASKYQWLLLQRELYTFFYNPYSKNIIRLPAKDIHFNRATFSTSPTSPDCICFVMQSHKGGDQIYISTCSPGNTEWCTTVFDGFKKVVEDVVYKNGKFYCIFSGGVLGVFDIADREWNVLTNMKPLAGKLTSPSRSRSQLVESNGDLLLFCWCEVLYVFKFNWSQNNWVRVTDLENRVIFLGCTSFSKPAEGEFSHLGNRIYYHGPRQTCFYSCNTGASQYCMEAYPWRMENSRERIWIEPPSC
ncbi:hypothetical protein ACFE04_020288 [Oxalis oulophora]